MVFDEKGLENGKTLLLLPGTCCNYETNFGSVIEELGEHYHLICVNYDGFDGSDLIFPDVITITEKIEMYIAENHGGSVDGALGSSLGGSFVGQLIQRQVIHMDHGAAIEYSLANIQTVSGTEDSRLLQFERMEDMLAYALDQFYLLHKKYYAIHEEIESLRHIDADVKALYDGITEKAVEGLIEKCPEQMQALPHLKERLYVAIGILDHYAHLQMDEDRCRGLDMEQMKKLSIEAAVAVIGG